MTDIKEKEVIELQFSGVFRYVLDNKGKFTKGQALDIALRKWEEIKNEISELGIIGVVTKEDIVVKK